MQMEGYSMFTYILENKEWIFSGIGISVIGLMFYFFKSKQKNSTAINENSNSVIVNINNTQENNQNKQDRDDCLIELKKKTKILFIDDDNKFKVVSILKNSGWVNTKIIKDINNIDSDEVRTTDIFFVDIQGVGKKLEFQDEGLGLANALKNKYPNKKVVIYSAENRGDRFHEALKKADDSLPKNAEPFQFQQTIENLLHG